MPINTILHISDMNGTEMQSYISNSGNVCFSEIEEDRPGFFIAITIDEWAKLRDFIDKQLTNG